MSTVTAYHEKINVAAIELTEDLKLGDKIKIGDKEMTVFSMEIDGMPIEAAKAGQSIGIKVKFSVKVNEEVKKL